MSTVLNTNGDKLQVPAIDGKCLGKFYVITAEWNTEITHSLRDSAVNVLKEGGVDEFKIVNISVPGTVELVNAAGLAANSGEAAAIIVIGCVIRGDTPHFDYVCNIASQGIAELNSRGETPVIFGVLTVNNLVQAQERAGGILGNKGGEAAVAAIQMANLHASFWSYNHL